MIFCAGGSVTTSSPGCSASPVSAARPSAGADLFPAAGWRRAARRRRLGRAAAAPPRFRAGRFAARRWCPAAAPKAATAPNPAAGRPAPAAADDCGSAAAGLAGVPAPLPRRRATAAAADCRADYCRADADWDPEKILVPICACAGGASVIVEAASRAAKPVRAMVRSILARL